MLPFFFFFFKAHQKSSLEMTEAKQDLGGDTPVTLLSSGLTLP